MTDGYFVTYEDAAQVEMTPGVHRRTMATTDEAMLCEFFLEQGSKITPHSHTNDQVGYIVYGQIKVTIGDEIYICKQGDSYAVPGGIVHSVQVLANSLTIDIFSPPRNDYRTEAR